MKYLLFVCSIALTSCSKSYTCECTDPKGGHLFNNSQIQGSKKDAAAKCKSYEYPGANLTCFIQ